MPMWKAQLRRDFWTVCCVANPWEKQSLVWSPHPQKPYLVGWLKGLLVYPAQCVQPERVSGPRVRHRLSAPRACTLQAICWPRAGTASGVAVTARGVATGS